MKKSVLLVLFLICITSVSAQTFEVDIINSDNPYIDIPVNFTARTVPVQSSATYTWYDVTSTPTTIFGDTIDAQRTFSTQGTHSIRVDVVSGGVTVSETKDILVGGPPPPPEPRIFANFRISADPYVNNPVTFTSTSSGDITGYTWFLEEDGSVTELGNSQNLQRTFTSPDTYYIRLTVRDADGNTNSKTKEVIVAGPPTANFEWKAPLYVDTNVRFESTSTGTVTSNTWQYKKVGEAQNIPVDSNSDIVYINFNSPGQYEVTLRVSDGITPDSITKTVTVEETFAHLWENYPDDCTIGKPADAAENYTFIGLVQTSGHFNQTPIGFELYCTKRFESVKTYYGDTFGNATFRFVGDPAGVEGGHVQSPEYNTFSNNVTLGNGPCSTTTTACSENQISLFMMSSPESAHIGDLNNPFIPQYHNYDYTLCCMPPELCYNGVDDDGDGFIDCADADCNGWYQTPQAEPKVCTGSPFNTTGCTNETPGSQNPDCEGPTDDDGDNWSFYCAHGEWDDGSLDPLGICCPAGYYPEYSEVFGWTCRESQECGIDPTFKCQDAFQNDPDKPDWLADKYTGVEGDWCNTQYDLLYTPTELEPYANPGSEFSTGCCYIPKHGEWNYWIHPENILIFG